MCTMDNDCPSFFVCYNTSWTQFQPTCLCSTYYGFSGPSCDITYQTPTALFRVISDSILLAIWTILLLVSMNYLFLLCRRSIRMANHEGSLNNNNTNNNKTTSFVAYLNKESLIYFFHQYWSISHTCQTQLFIAAVFGIAQESLDLIIIQRPTMFISSSRGEKLSYYYRDKIVVATTGSAFIFLAFATLPMHWRDIANRALRADSPRSYIKRLLFYECSFLITMLSVAIFSYPEYLFIALLPFMIILMISFGIGGFSLWRVLVKADVDEQKKQRFLKSARALMWFCFNIFGLSILILICSLIFFLLSGEARWRELSPPNVISTVNVFGFIMKFSFQLGAICGQYYLSKTIKSIISRQVLADQATGISNDSKGNNNNNLEKNHQIEPASTVQADSIVGYDTLQAIKKKKKKMKNKHLKPIKDEDDDVQQEELQADDDEHEQTY